MQLMYSYAHAVAIMHLLTGRTREWVATGSTNGKATPVAVTISQDMRRATSALTQLLIYVGLACGALTYGFDEYWAMIGLAVLGAYVHLPLLFMSLGTAKIRGSTTDPRQAIAPGQANA